MGPNTEVASGSGSRNGSNGSKSSGGKDVNENASARGQKRPHADLECSNSCDCEEFGAPLSKRLNNLNVDYSANNKHPHQGGQLQHPHQGGQLADLRGAQGTCEGQGSGSKSEAGEGINQGFNYPYPADSNYYSSNQLLNKMYAARCQRNPQIRHNPN